MSILNTVVDAMMPTNTDPTVRPLARQRARQLATPGDWLAQILDQHLQIEEAFAALLRSTDAANRRASERELAALLTAHSLAEEAVIYPAIAATSDRAQATQAYAEQARAKQALAMLETLDPMQPAYVQQVERLRGDVSQHLFEEEGSWLPSLQRATLEADRLRISRRFAEEFQRYMQGARSGQGGQPVPARADGTPAAVAAYNSGMSR